MPARVQQQSREGGQPACSPVWGPLASCVLAIAKTNHQKNSKHLPPLPKRQETIKKKFKRQEKRSQVLPEPGQAWNQKWPCSFLTNPDANLPLHPLALEPRSHHQQQHSAPSNRAWALPGPKARTAQALGRAHRSLGLSRSVLYVRGRGRVALACQGSTPVPLRSWGGGLCAGCNANAGRG